MQAASQRAQTTEPSEHLVQFYEADPAAWAKSVGRYLADGLKRGEAVLVIATPEHQESYRPAAQRFRPRRGICRVPRPAGISAMPRATLAQFMVAGEPDWDRFQVTVGRRNASGFVPLPSAGLFALMARWWGFSGAPRNSPRPSGWKSIGTACCNPPDFKLFCGYPINIFTDDFNHAHVDAVVCAHTHVLPTGENGDLQEAVTRALDEVSGSQAPSSWNA